VNPSDEVLAEADRILTREIFLDWLRHPVTRVLGIVIAAEVAHRLIMHYGIKALHLGEDQ
jgi:hypothetical protein